MQLLILYYKTKQNRYANFLLQLLIELLSKHNIAIHQASSLTEAKRSYSNNGHSALIIHQNKPSLSFFNRWQLRSFNKKNKVHLVLQLNTNTPLHSSAQELICLKEIEKWGKIKTVPSSLKIAVHSNAAKQKLMLLCHVPEPNIGVVSFAAGAAFQPVDWSKKQSLKMQYSQGKEYFFVYAEGKTFDTFMSLLKAFSSFKKWQHSSMKLLVLGRLFFTKTKEWNEKLNTYKYRNDVVLVSDADEAEQTALLASAYVFIHAPLHDDDVLPILQAMQCETPCISFVSESLKEYANEAAILIEHNNFEQLGEKMILLYKDETLRSELIEKGKQQTQLYAKENALQLLQTALPTSLFE